MRTSDLLGNLERFWRRVDRSGDCWLWTGETNGMGYGRFELWQDGKRTRIFAHRLVLTLHGQDPGDKFVLHTCDNPPCVNPAHLRTGTQKDNMRDAMAKGRANLSGLELGRIPHAERKLRRPTP